MFLRLNRRLRPHNERKMCLLHHALGDGESPNLMTISLLIPHLRVPGWHPYTSDIGGAVVPVQPPLVVP